VTKVQWGEGVDFGRYLECPLDSSWNTLFSQ